MQIEFETTRANDPEDRVVTLHFDEDAMGEIRGYLAERGNEEIQAIFADAEPIDDPTFHVGLPTVDDEGNYIGREPFTEYRVTLPQAAREPFVAVLSGIGAGGVADDLTARLEA